MEQNRSEGSENELKKEEILNEAFLSGFTISSEEEAKVFQDYLLMYSHSHTGAKLPYVDIVSSYKKLMLYENYGKRIYYALLDLKINFVLLTLDNFFSGETWNSACEICSDKKTSVLENYTFFKGRMEFHRHEANYILRYRAIFDKILGLFVLIHDQNKYDKTFTAAKSRKREFSKLAPDINFLDPTYVDEVISFLKEFDDKFRTAEIHNTGSLRKWTFLMNSFHETPILFLRKSWNYLLKNLSELDRLIAEIEQKENKSTNCNS